MARKLIDLSMHLENDVPSDPPGLEPHIEYHTHKQTASEAVDRSSPDSKEGAASGWRRLGDQNGCKPS